MAVENDPTSFLWLLAAIGFATILAGAVPLVALSGMLGRADPSESLATVIVIAAVVFILALVMFAPVYVIWRTAFILLLRYMPDTRHRAALSTCLCVVVGNLAAFAFALKGSIPDGRTVHEMALLVIFTTLFGVGLTWWAFRNESLT